MNSRRRFVPSNWLTFGIGAGVLAPLMTVAMMLHSFLAVNRPLGKGILVVEAWIPTRALAEAERVFQSQHYTGFVLVGGPVKGLGKPSGRPMTYDALATQRLAKLGYDTTKITKISVPAEPEGRRTLSSAQAVDYWLVNSGTSVCCVDVFTVSVHARKSWILFRHALGDRYQVGIISGAEAWYDRSPYWFFSKHALYIFARNLAGYAYSEWWILPSYRG